MLIVIKVVIKVIVLSILLLDEIAESESKQSKSGQEAVKLEVDMPTATQRLIELRKVVNR